MDTQEKKSVSERVFEKIEAEQIKPVAACKFIVETWLWLIISGLLFLIAIVHVSMASHYLASLEPELLLIKKTKLVIGALPYALFALVLFFLYLSSRAYRRSRKYCRHEEITLLGFLAFGAISLGFSAYSAHLDYAPRKVLESSGIYRNVLIIPKEFWSQPGKGTLSGEIESRAGEKTFILKDWEENNWRVRLETPFPVLITKQIKLLGNEQGDNYFVAQNVWVWKD